MGINYNVVLKGITMKRILAITLLFSSFACIAKSTTQEELPMSTQTISYIQHPVDGIKYAIVQEGAADAPVAKAGQKVRVHYTGWLKNNDGSLGNKFDSSHNRNQPFEFILGAGFVITGWDKGVEGMKVGEIRRLELAPHVAYGAQEIRGLIPKNSTLIFDVELLGVN